MVIHIKPEIRFLEIAFNPGWPTWSEHRACLPRGLFIRFGKIMLTPVDSHPLIIGAPARNIKNRLCTRRLYSFVKKVLHIYKRFQGRQQAEGRDPEERHNHNDVFENNPALFPYSAFQAYNPVV